MKNIFNSNIWIATKAIWSAFCFLMSLIFGITILIILITYGAPPLQEVIISVMCMLFWGALLSLKMCIDSIIRLKFIYKMYKESKMINE